MTEGSGLRLFLVNCMTFAGLPLLTCQLGRIEGPASPGWEGCAPAQNQKSQFELQGPHQVARVSRERMVLDRESVLKVWPAASATNLSHDFGLQSLSFLRVRMGQSECEN